jgi:hypothetical protein
MKIIAFPEDEEVIEKILRHLGLWEGKVRPPLKVKVPSLYRFPSIPPIPGFHSLGLPSTRIRNIRWIPM